MPQIVTPHIGQIRRGQQRFELAGHVSRLQECSDRAGQGVSGLARGTTAAGAF
jgi:hypothetical protein